MHLPDKVKRNILRTLFDQKMLADIADGIRFFRKQEKNSQELLDAEMLFVDAAYKKEQNGNTTNESTRERHERSGVAGEGLERRGVDGNTANSIEDTQS